MSVHNLSNKDKLEIIKLYNTGWYEVDTYKMIGELLSISPIIVGQVITSYCTVGISLTSKANEDATTD